MKEVLKSLSQLKAKTQSLLSVADNKIDQTQPTVFQIKAALEKIEGDIHRTTTDVEKIKDEFEPNARIFLNAVTEKQIPDFTERLHTQEQALRKFE